MAAESSFTVVPVLQSRGRIRKIEGSLPSQLPSPRKVPGALVREGTLMTSLPRAPRPASLRDQGCPGKGLVSEENQQEEELA